MTENTWPIVDIMPNQPDERLMAFTCGERPTDNLSALNTALSMATSCLTSCATPNEESGSTSEQNRKYANEVIDNITYLRLANFEAANV